MNWTRQGYSGLGGGGLGGQWVTEEGRRGVRRCGKLYALQGWAGKAPPWWWSQGKAGPRARGVKCRRGQQTV